MSKLDRLNARVSKLLTSAVEEVLEVVKDTVSEYQAKTARTQRENEKLQRKLQELQQKLQQELAPVSRRNVLTQTTSSDTPTPTNSELDLSEAPAESVLKLEPRAVPNKDKEGEHYVGPLLHQQGELPAYTSVEIDKVDCALPLSVVTCSFGDESSLGHPDEINQRSPNDLLIRSCPADLHIIKAEPEGQESFLSTHAGAHTRTIDQQHTSSHTHTLNQQLSGTHRHIINQQHTKAHRPTVNQQQTRGHRPALDDHLTESHGQTLDRQPGAGAAASPCDPAEVDVALDLLPPCGDRAPLHFMQSDSLNALMEELPLDNSQCSGVLPIEPTQGLESLPLVMTQGLGHRGQQRWWRRALRGDTHHCVLCGKTFGRLDNLRIHQRCHTGEKPYTCGHCGRRFSHAGNLKKHKRVHTGEKPYGCLQCGKMFSQSTHLKKHQKVHSHRYLTGS